MLCGNAGQTFFCFLEFRWLQRFTKFDNLVFFLLHYMVLAMTQNMESRKQNSHGVVHLDPYGSIYPTRPGNRPILNFGCSRSFKQACSKRTLVCGEFSSYYYVFQAYKDHFRHNYQWLPLVACFQTGAGLCSSGEQKIKFSHTMWHKHVSDVYKHTSSMAQQSSTKYAGEMKEQGCHIATVLVILPVTGFLSETCCLQQCCPNRNRVISPPKMTANINQVTVVQIHSNMRYSTIWQIKLFGELHHSALAGLKIMSLMAVIWPVKILR